MYVLDVQTLPIGRRLRTAAAGHCCASPYLAVTNRLDAMVADAVLQALQRLQGATHAARSAQLQVKSALWSTQQAVQLTQRYVISHVLND